MLPSGVWITSPHSYEEDPSHFSLTTKPWKNLVRPTPRPWTGYKKHADLQLWDHLQKGSKMPANYLSQDIMRPSPSNQANSSKNRIMTRWFSTWRNFCSMENSPRMLASKASSGSTKKRFLCGRWACMEMNQTTAGTKPSSFVPTQNPSARYPPRGPWKSVGWSQWPVQNLRMSTAVLLMAQHGCWYSHPPENLPNVWLAMANIYSIG